MSSIAVNTITDASGGNSVSINSYTPTASNMAGRNRIINGDMRIDQRNAGGSVSTASGSNFYTVDRWRMYQSQVSKYTLQQNQGSISPPAGFSNYLGITSSSAYTVGASELFLLQHFVEGFNIADLGWGTASAKTVTLSFWVRSSLTGTFGGSLLSNGNARSYPFVYTINSANTWEQKSITIAGDTSGTWLTNNGVGINLNFSIGTGATLSGTAGSWAGSSLFSATGATSVVGTSGATFYITGVQLEEGSVATPFERRPYGTELALCQRYCYVFRGVGADASLGSGNGYTTSAINIMCSVPTTMRTAPSITTSSGNWLYYATGSTSAVQSATPTLGDGTTSNPSSFRLYLGGISGITTGANYWVIVNTNHFLALSAEL